MLVHFIISSTQTQTHTLTHTQKKIKRYSYISCKNYISLVLGQLLPDERDFMTIMFQKSVQNTKFGNNL